MSKSLQEKEQEFAATAAMLSGILSVVGLASAATFEWVGALTEESYDLTMYKAGEQLHYAAPAASTFPTAWIVILLVVGSGILYCSYKFFMRRKSR